MSMRFPPIPQFVEPYPDESCYSMLCRCLVRAGMSTAKFCRDMFKNQRLMSCFLWQPFRATDLNRWFDDTPQRMPTYLKQSCISYRYPFVGKICQSDFENWGAGEELDNGAYHKLTLVLGYRKWTKRHLYYCPECVKADRKEYGETYWHMIPQLPGVYVCPVHAVPLEESAVMLSNAWMDLNPAEYWLHDTEPRRETISYEDLRIAADSKWLMEYGWEKEIKLPELLKGMSNWEFEQAEAKATRFTKQSNVKNDTIYHILLANLKGKSISEFVEHRKKLLPINVF